jgi:hypothetical protein
MDPSPQVYNNCLFEQTNIIVSYIYVIENSLRNLQYKIVDS